MRLAISPHYVKLEMLNLSSPVADKSENSIDKNLTAVPGICPDALIQRKLRDVVVVIERYASISLLIHSFCAYLRTFESNIR